VVDARSGGALAAFLDLAREARTLRRFEQEVTRRARHTLVVKCAERDLLVEHRAG
jgi:hypothetical protein